MMKTFRDIVNEDATLYEQKNSDYAKGGSEHGNFERVAMILSLYPDLSPNHPVVVNIIYLLKQLDCVLWSFNIGSNPKIENRERRLQDIAIYANIARLMESKEVEYERKDTGGRQDSFDFTTPDGATWYDTSADARADTRRAWRVG